MDKILKKHHVAHFLIAYSMTLTLALVMPLFWAFILPSGFYSLREVYQFLTKLIGRPSWHQISRHILDAVAGILGAGLAVVIIRGVEIFFK